MDRQVTRCRKDRHGNVLLLCNPGTDWSPRMKQDAIRDTEMGLHTYFVRWSDGQSTEIRIDQGPNGKYLRTTKDDPTRNDLEDLPDC